MSSKSASLSKGLSKTIKPTKENMAAFTTPKGFKKTKTFNQSNVNDKGKDKENDVLYKSVKTVMMDKRRLCERVKSGFSLSACSNPLSFSSGFSSNSPNCTTHTNGQLLFNTIGNDTNTNPNTNRLNSPYKDVKLEFIEDNKNNNTDATKGYQFNIDHKLMCLICRNLMTDPCKCYKCSTCYCRNCIETAITNTNKCPKCFSMIGTGSLIPIDMTPIYSSTVINCPIPGCKDSFNLLDIKKHIAECAFQEAKETQRVNVNKILPSLNNEDDSYVKLHLLSYLKNVNAIEMTMSESIIMKEEERKKMESALGSNSGKTMKQENDLLTLKININHCKNVLEKNVIDISNATKKINETIKNILNKLPKDK